MKEYKGWQIVKMLDEKVLKVGEELTVTYGDITKELVVVANALAGALYLEEKYSENPAPSSYFARNAVFRVKSKPITFLEAMKMVDEGLEVTNDSVEKYKGTYKKIDGEFKYLEDGEIKNDIEIFSSEFKNNWYVYQ